MDNNNSSETSLLWRDLFADNSDWRDPSRGLLLFSKTIFPSLAYDETPFFHYELYRDLLQLYNPKYRFAQERQLQEIIFRGGSKSTISSLIFPTYIACMNGFNIKIADWDRSSETDISMNGIEVKVDEDLIIIVSETGSVAENWIVTIRGTLSKNPFIREIFGNFKQQALRDDEGKWTRSGFAIIKDSSPIEWQRGQNLTLLGKGVNMQQRGINVRGRPTLIIFDDLYSLNNTKTPESRQKVRYIADAEIRNSIDPKKGKIVSIGTVVHEDTIVVDYKKSRFWFTIERPIMEKWMFDEILTKYCKVDRDKCQMSYPARDKCQELELLGYKTFWPARWTLEMLLAKYAEYIEKRTESMFWQEYFHITVAESDKKIRRDMLRFRQLSLVEKQIGGVWYSFVKIEDADENVRYVNVNVAIGVDAAISYKLGADNSAIVMVGMDWYGRIYVLRNVYGRFGISDEFKEEYKDKYVNKLCTDRGHIERVGTTDEIFRMLLGLHTRPKLVIEINSIGNEVYRQIKNKMNYYPVQRCQIIEVSNTINKEERILDTLQPYYQSRSVYHNSLDNQEELIYELEFIGKTRHDDNADALATAIANLTKPSSSVKYEESNLPQEKHKYTPPDWLHNGRDMSIVKQVKTKWRVM